MRSTLASSNHLQRKQGNLLIVFLDCRLSTTIPLLLSIQRLIFQPTKVNTLNNIPFDWFDYHLQPTGRHNSLWSKDRFKLVSLLFLRLDAFWIFVIKRLSLKSIVIDSQGAQNPEASVNKSVWNTARSDLLMYKSDLRSAGVMKLQGYLPISLHECSQEIILRLPHGFCWHISPIWDWGGSWNSETICW